jgi:transposase
MIRLSTKSKILLAVKPVDFRRGIDGLCGLCRIELGENPRSGSVFVFINRNRTQIKILTYDGTGFWLVTKRLSEGRYKWWPKTVDPITGCDAKRLIVLLWGENPDLVSDPGLWQKVS